MRTRSFFPALPAIALLLAACGGGGGGEGGAGTTTTDTTATTGTSSTTTTSTSTTVDKAAMCASTFGQDLTNNFGRLDGTVLAVVQPSDTQCTAPNDDHVVLQVRMNGEAYRMVINIQSSFGDPDVRFLAIDHALPVPAWNEGWHIGLALDYATDFGVHSSSSPFTPHPLAELSGIVADAITIGQKVSVYATSSGGDSAHKIHRNEGLTDGAIVLDADSANPHVLLFHFSDQLF
jgi:hypothetical protein